MSSTAKLLTFLLTILTSLLIFKQPIQATGNLENSHDYLNISTPYTTDVEHEVGFTLPTNSPQISSTDYIIIDLSSFSDITNATSITGNYIGTPTITLDGTNSLVKVTNIVVLPGGSISIHGITGTNPAATNQYYVTVTVAEDEDGTIIKNTATFLAASFGGQVSVTASIEAPVAALQITGYAAPETFITFTENGSVIGTDSANSSGLFSQIFYGLEPRTHTVSLYGIDTSGRTTSILTLDVYTPIYQQTTVSNLLLSPTIEINTSTIAQGDDLIVTGTSVPDGDLTLFTESPLRSYYSTADSSGNWNYTIDNTSEYIAGDYIVYTLVQSGALQSIVSTSLGFQITTAGITPTPAGCDISQGDLNCDSNTNLTDFSVLMFYWGTTHPAGDINSDGSVNLTDFSVLMYYWGT